ncbi:MAG: aminotransferase class V-fold PLP-dependent enzyme [Planctomycetota bacterium]|jgi:selenocysteine lyase/cysteine desulfurase
MNERHEADSGMIYLDHAATAHPRHPGVPEAMAAAIEIAGSVGRGSHGGARGATAIVGSCRERLADLFGASDPSRMVLFPSSTLALSTILADLGARSPAESVIWIGPLEHNAVWRPAVRAFGEERVRLLPAGPSGRVDLEGLEALDPGSAAGVVLQHASNVNGVIQPIAEVGAWAARAGLPLVVDGAQAAGLVPTSLERIPALAAYTMAGHKYLGGGPGVGVCWLAEGFEPSPLWIGGNGIDSDQARIPERAPGRYESGTPNLPGIAGLERALAHFDAHPVADRFAHLNAVRREWRAALEAIPGLELVGETGEEEARSPVLAVRIPGLDPTEVAGVLDARAGVRCRSGLHCAPLAHRHFDTLAGGGTLRIAPGEETSPEERRRVVALLAEIAAG